MIGPRGAVLEELLAPGDEEEAGGTKFSPDANAAGACRPAVSTVRVMHAAYPSHTRGYMVAPSTLRALF